MPMVPRPIHRPSADMQAVVGQGSSAAASADNKSGLDDPKVAMPVSADDAVEALDSIMAASRRAALNSIARMSSTNIALPPIFVCD